MLLLTNFGERERLTVAGVPVGRLLPDRHRATPPSGRPARASASSSPTRRSTARGCARLARRIGLGLARTGSTAHHGSGEIFLAVVDRPRRDRDGTSGGRRRGRRPGLDDLFEAVVDAAEEAVLNSLLARRPTVGRDGNTSEGLDPTTVVRLLRGTGTCGH